MTTQRSDDESRSSHSPASRSREGQRDPFALLVDGVSEYAIYMLDRHGFVRTWNPGAERIKGYSATDVVGQHVSLFYRLEDVEAEAPARELDTAVSEGNFVGEGWRVRKDGSTFWANIVITALWGDDGRLRGFAKVVRDETERREAERDRARLRVIEAQEHVVVDAVDEVIERLRHTASALASAAAGIEASSPAHDDLLRAVADLDASIGYILGALRPSLEEFSRTPEHPASEQETPRRPLRILLVGGEDHDNRDDSG